MATDDGQTAVLALLQKDGWQLWFHMLCARFTSTLVKELMAKFPAVAAAKVVDAGECVCVCVSECVYVGGWVGGWV